MLDLNLLPPLEKEKIEKRGKSFFIISFLYLIFIFSLMLSISFFSIYLYLSILVRNQEDLVKEKNASIVYQKVKNLDEEIITINSRINKIYNIQKKFIHISPILEEIADLLPENEVYLTMINISPKIEVTIQEEEPKEEEEPVSKDEEKSSEEEKKVQKRVEKEFIEINMKGFAKTREQVIEVERLLRSSSMFSNIVSPVDNIIYPTDINFVFTARLRE